LWTRATSRRQRHRQQSDEDRSHDQEDVRPTHACGEHESDRSADDRGGAVTELIDGRQQLDWSLLIRLVYSPRVDSDVVARCGDRCDEGDQDETPDRHRRIGKREQRQTYANDQLPERNPALAPSEPFKTGEPHPIDDRGPEELERVGKTYPRKDANRGEFNADLA